MPCPTAHVQPSWQPWTAPAAACPLSVFACELRRFYASCLVCFLSNLRESRQDLLRYETSDVGKRSL